MGAIDGGCGSPAGQQKDTTLKHTFFQQSDFRAFCISKLESAV
jgi:hypothetical protein